MEAFQLRGLRFEPLGRHLIEGIALGGIRSRVGCPKFLGSREIFSAIGDFG